MANTAYLFLTITAVFWGGNSVAGKLALGHVSPMMLVSLRWLIASAVMLPLAWKRFREDWPVIRPHLPLLAALGASGFTLFNALFYTALNYTTAINVSIEQAGVPILIILANFIFFRLRIKWPQIFGVILTILGVALTASHGDPKQLLALHLNFGDVLMLIAVLFYSGYSVGLRLKPALQWQSLMLTLSLAAFVVSVPFALWEIAIGKAVFPDIQGWAVTLYTALPVAILSQMLYIRGVEMIGANRAGIFVNLVPIFGTLLAVALIGEKFAFYQAIALVLVLGGIWLAETSGRKTATD